MSCRFSIPVDTPPAELLSRARAALAGAGGRLDGDEREGRIEAPTPLGRIFGTYEVKDGEVSFDIGTRPAFISCARIEARLRELLR